MRLCPGCGRPLADAATIHTLMRHSARWAIAAEQDREPLIRALHANYAMGYILALREVASDADVLATTGYDPYVLFVELLHIQDEATRQVARACPQLTPQPMWLAQVAGEG